MKADDPRVPKWWCSRHVLRWPKAPAFSLRWLNQLSQRNCGCAARTRKAILPLSKGKWHSCKYTLLFQGGVFWWPVFKELSHFTEQSTLQKTLCPKEPIPIEAKTRSRKYSHICRSEAKGIYLSVVQKFCGQDQLYWDLSIQQLRHKMLLPLEAQSWQTFSLILSLSFHFTFTAKSSIDLPGGRKYFFASLWCHGN